MISRDIRAYLARDWAAARDSRDAYWAERIERLGPSEDDRREDFLAHVRLRALLDRAHLPGRG